METTIQNLCRPSAQLERRQKDMLQIISGKFFGTGEIIHNECNGILYSNASFHAIQPIDYGNIKN